MKLAIIGSREIYDIELESFVPEQVSEIVSGGAKGIDTLVREFAKRKSLKITEFLPKYNIYGKAAPLKRNEEIAKYADAAIVFWNGKSKGTQHTINLFKKLEKAVTVYIVNNPE